MKVVKGKNQVSQPGIIMANGMVLKDGIHKFEADERIVKESLSYIAKISKGLYSGILNSDPDFIEYQQESINKLVEIETDKLCKKVVLGAESQLKMISTNMMANKITERSYTKSLYSSNDIPEIDILGEESIKDSSKTKSHTEKIQSIISQRGNELASLGDEELKYVKEINKEVDAIFRIREKVKEKMKQKKLKKKSATKDERILKEVTNKLKVQNNIKVQNKMAKKNDRK